MCILICWPLKLTIGSINQSGIEETWPQRVSGDDDDGDDDDEKTVNGIVTTLLANAFDIQQYFLFAFHEAFSIFFF